MKALTACKRPVSGTISLPSRGTFHHSLTVLSTIGHQEVFRQPSGLGRFTQDSTSPVLLGQTVPDTHQPVPPTGVSPTTPRLPRRFSYRPAHAPPLRQKRNRTAPQPRTRNPCRVSHAHGLTIIRFRSPLLTEYPFLQVLRCFTSLRTPRPKPVPTHDGRWVPPFGNPRIKALLAAPRGISQPQTSFIGPVCQGIHHTPLQATHHESAWPQDSSSKFPDDKSSH